MIITHFCVSSFTFFLIWILYLQRRVYVYFAVLMCLWFHNDCYFVSLCTPWLFKGQAQIDRRIAVNEREWKRMKGNERGRRKILTNDDHRFFASFSASCTFCLQILLLHVSCVLKYLLLEDHLTLPVTCFALSQKMQTKRVARQTKNLSTNVTSSSFLRSSESKSERTTLSMLCDHKH